MEKAGKKLTASILGNKVSMEKVEEEKPPQEEELQREFDNSIFIAKIDEFLNERKK